MRYPSLLIEICCSFALASAAGAASGQLDPTFGHAGISVTSFGNDVRPIDAALQADGKLVVVGGLNDFRTATQLAVVIRFMPDGSLDESFGRHGVATDAVSNFINEAEALVIQSDGKIVILEQVLSANSWVNQFVLVRFRADGARDSSFGASGRSTLNFPHPAFFATSADVLALQPNQALLVGGSVIAPRHNPTPTRTVLARVTANGRPDGTFGTRGVAESVAIGAPEALAVLSDGTILAVNNSQQTAGFSSNGVLLPHAHGGLVTAATHRGTIAFRPDGDFLIAAGGQGPSGENDMDVSVRLLEPSGIVDPSFQSPLFDFGAGGPYVNLAQAIAIGPTGEIAVGGLSQTMSFNDDFGMALLTENGALEQHFAHGGMLTTSFPHGGQVLAVVVQPDGKLIAIGQSFSSDTAIPVDLAVARYLTQ